MIWCPRFPIAPFLIHLHISLCICITEALQRGGDLNPSVYIHYFIVVSYLGEKKRSWILSVIFLHPPPPMCCNLGFTCGEDRIGEVSDIFRGVRGEGTELAGTPNTLSQAGKQLCGAITAPALVAQGTGIQPQASPYSLPILHQHHWRLLQLIPITTGLSQPISFPSCLSMSCPMQHRESDLQKILNPHCLGHSMGVMVTLVTPLASSPLCSHGFQDTQTFSQRSNILNPAVHAL